MGSMSSTVLIASFVGAAALAYGYNQYSRPSTHHTPSNPDTSIKKPGQAAQPGKKSKKNKSSGKNTSDPESQLETKPIVVAFPPVIAQRQTVPGDFDSSVEPLSELQVKPKKPKKKKARKVATAVPGTQSDSSAGPGPSSRSSLQPSQPLPQPPRKPDAVDTDGSWTQVSSHSRRKQEGSEDTAARSAEHTSDAGLAASSVGDHSDEDEVKAEQSENRKTLAEKMLPKPRKTGVEDMTETPDHPSIARVMRVQPRAGEQPAVGFSWGDYEDVDADGEDDDGGWGVVKSRRRKTPTSTSATTQPTPEFKAPEAQTKKQRQNAAKRDAQKAAKAEAEAERLAALAKHKRELERQRMAEQAAPSRGKKTSGGMVASVDENGKLVWE